MKIVKIRKDDLYIYFYLRDKINEQFTATIVYDTLTENFQIYLQYTLMN